ncbi:MAG TPA: LemA domain-containing protein [Planctomycetes bacterium]|nr:LemA domain-containing protein [Planctomycetota bacterium]
MELVSCMDLLESGFLFRGLAAQIDSSLGSLEQIPWQPLAIGFAAVALWILLAELSVRARRKQRLIDDVPTCKTAGVFIGLVEVKGTAESDDPLVSFLADRLCVHYSYTVSEQWRRLVTETYTDSKGNTRTRTRMKTGWDTVDQGTRSCPFYLEDDTGLLRILPVGADIDSAALFSRTCGREDALYYDKGPQSSVYASTGTRRFVENGIPLHRRIYVMGTSRLQQDVVAPEIASDPQSPLFLISVKSEAQKSSSYNFQFWGWFLLGFITAVAIPAWVLASADGGPAWISAGLCGAAFFCYWSARWVVMVYNSLMSLRNRVEQAWNNVDVQLKRRHDLIPQLVEVVTGYQQHEARLQEHLVLLRNEAQIAIGEVATACTPSVNALKEAHPELRANSLFIDLHEELIRTEEKVALARGYYNDIVEENNERVERIPDRFFGSLAKMRRRKYYEARSFERAAVQVDLVTEQSSTDEERV